MELVHYGRFVKRHLALILGTAVVVAAVAGITAAVQKDHAEAAGSVLIKVKDDRQLTAYDYDQFYVMQATEQYASNVVGWLNSSQTRDDVRRAADLTTGEITAKKNGGTVELTATGDTPLQAAALAKATDALIVDRTAQLAPGPNRSSFQATPLPIASHAVKPTPLRNAGIGFVAGLILGLVLALIAEAARPARRKG